MLRQVASDNGLTAQIDATLAAVTIDRIIAQTGEWDMHLVTRLARRFGAIGKVAQGQLVFAPRGAGTTASGAAMSAGTYTPNDFETFRILELGPQLPRPVEVPDLGPLDRQGLDRQRLGRIRARLRASRDVRLGRRGPGHGGPARSSSPGRRSISRGPCAPPLPCRTPARR